MKNKVILIGRVGQDPEVKTTNAGIKVCNMSLATSETWKDKQGVKQTDTQWHRLTIWDKSAEIAEKYVKKGDIFCVEGKILYREFVDKEGVKRYTSEIVVDEMTLMPNERKEA